MKQTIILIIALAVLIIGFSSIYIINEAEQAVVTQFGKPVGSAITDTHPPTPPLGTGPFTTVPQSSYDSCLRLTE